MKKILSFLLTIVFLQSQTFAISGGPFGETGGSVNIIGAYSGVLIPTDTAGDTVAIEGENLAALGLFSLGMPDAGVGTGAFVMFTQGEIFNGTITATGDPADGAVRGILEGTFDYVDFVYDQNGAIVYDIQVDAQGNVSATPTTTTYQAAVRGTMEATVTSTNTPTQDQAVSGNFGRIAGTAKMGRIFFAGGGVSVTDKTQFYTVDGVKQSVTNTTGGGVGTQGNGGGGGGGGGLILIL